LLPVLLAYLAIARDNPEVRMDADGIDVGPIC
jgi:hypothetical protein